MQLRLLTCLKWVTRGPDASRDRFLFVMPVVSAGVNANPCARFGNAQADMLDERTRLGIKVLGLTFLQSFCIRH